MGKSKKAFYDEKALVEFRKYLMNFRILSKRVNVPKPDIESSRIPEALKMLPKQRREIIEKYFGLLEGTTNHSKKEGKVSSKDIAFKAMHDSAMDALRIFTSKIEVIGVYDNSVDKLIAAIYSKIDRTGINLSNKDIVRYLMMHAVVFECGPRFSFEIDQMKIDSEEGNDGYYLDEYEVLRELYEQFLEEEESGFNNYLIKMRYFINAIEMLNLEDVITLRKMFGISNSKVFEEKEIKALGQLGISVSNEPESEIFDQYLTFGELRKFKEKIFDQGAWGVTMNIINGVPLEHMKPLWEKIAQIYMAKSPVEELEKYKTERYKRFVTSQGMQELLLYDIEGYKFTDVREVDFLRLYVA